MAGPDQNPAGRHPAFRQMPGGFLPPDVLQGPPPPPPPPGMGGEWGGPPRPTSGKAIASLVCGLGGLLLGFFCPVLAVAVLVGLVLGIMGIAETGRDGTRAGRGLAIAGTTASGLSVLGSIALALFFVSKATEAGEMQDEYFVAGTTQDFNLIAKRVADYYRQNGDSLGEGGPVLAQPGGPDQPAASGNSGITTPVTSDRARVTGALQLSHLVDETEFSQHPYVRYELIITGRSTATIRASRGAGEAREARITDAATGTWMPTGP